MYSGYTKTECYHNVNIIKVKTFEMLLDYVNKLWSNNCVLGLFLCVFVICLFCLYVCLLGLYIVLLFFTCRQKTAQTLLAKLLHIFIEHA